jgi:drug/metabolite transporter (DMT)-like permease
VGPSTSLPDPGKSIYILVSLIAVFSYAVEGNFVAKYGLRGLDPVQTLVGASVVGVILVTPIVLATGQWVDLSVRWQSAEWAILIQSVLHGIAYSGYVWLVGRAGSVFAAQVGYLVTGFGVLWSIVLLDETYSGWIWMALVLMMVGLTLVQPRRPDNAPQKTVKEPLVPEDELGQT